MPWKPRIRPPAIKCGTCGGIYRNRIAHVCKIRGDRPARKAPARLVAPSVQLWTCPDCGKPAGLRHTCVVKRGDFKRRQAAYEKEQARARRKAAAAKRKAARHDPDGCEDQDCPAYGCVQYRRGRERGHDEGFDEGFSQGVAAGRAGGG